MFYVKTKINEETEIRTEITDENVFTVCPQCGLEHAVDLEAVLNDGGSLCGSACLCSECSEEHLAMQEHIRKRENA